MRTLSLRALNRALLERQCLLERSPSGARAIVEQVAGLQAQVAQPPFLGMWARQQGFTVEGMRAALLEREVVRATLMRSTIHLVSADHYALFRPALQPALTRALRGFFGARQKDLDFPALVTAAKEFFDGEPGTFAGLRDELRRQNPELDAQAMAYVIRTHLPLVQVPHAISPWGYPGVPEYVEAHVWLGRAVETGLEEEADATGLVRAYLRAFGPASVADAQQWSGRAGLAATFKAMRDELVSYRDEAGRELFDLAGTDLPGEDALAPVRLMPEYDNLVLGHKDRTRVIADGFKKQVFLSAARVRATILVDGFVAGAWRLEAAREAVRVVLEPFVALDAASRAAIEEEAARLVSVWPDVAKIEVSWEGA
jgi:hypothetical protein